MKENTKKKKKQANKGDKPQIRRGLQEKEKLCKKKIEKKEFKKISTNKKRNKKKSTA